MFHLFSSTEDMARHSNFSRKKVSSSGAFPYVNEPFTLLTKVKKEIFLVKFSFFSVRVCRNFQIFTQELTLWRNTSKFACPAPNRRIILLLGGKIP